MGDSDTEPVTKRVDRLIGFEHSGSTKVEASKEHTEFGRSPFERDVDRLKYLPQVRRLKDVTQVARSGESYLYHDRLSHSIKVAQVGRRLAELIRRREIITTDKARQALRDLNNDLGVFSASLASGFGVDLIDDRLGGNLNPDVVEASCLAHDMGHPPFGHLAEEELDELIYSKTHPDKELGQEVDPDEEDERAIDNDNERIGLRFEGNAQSFRILTRLAVHPSAEHGLGVTRATLNGVLKYPWGRGEWSENNEGKFGYYLADHDAFQFAREQPSVTPREPSLEAAIMDYADDLSYAVHDTTDFFKSGHIPLSRLTKEADPEESGTGETELESFISHISEETEIEYPGEVTRRLFQIFRGLQKSLYKSITSEYTGRRKQEKAVDEFSSHLISWFLNADTVEPNRVFIDYDDEKNQLMLNFSEIELNNGEYTTVEELLKVMQELTMHYVIQNPSLMAQQQGQRKVVRTLYEVLLDEANKPEGWSALPEEYQDYAAGDHPGVHPDSSQPDRCARVVADFIARMTEPQAIEMFQRLTGHVPGSLENRIVR